jgi:hypothetical protein
MKLVIIVFLSFVFSACTVTKEKKVEVGSRSLQPKSKPVYNQTNMERALRCIDDRLSENTNIQKVRIYVDSNFPDLGEAGVRSTRDMIITALMKLSARSKKVGAIIYTQRSDLTNMMTAVQKTSSEFRFPEYFLRGSITQAEKKHSVGGKTSSASLGIPKVLNVGVKDSVKDVVSSVGLDLHLGSLKSSELISGMYSSNMLSIVQQDEAGDVYAGVMDKADFEYEVEFSEREGMSAAVRTLTELGVLEIVGKLFDLDYQSCVNPQGSIRTYSKPQPIPEIVNQEINYSGDFSIEMTSDRGSNPIYSRGESIRVVAFPQDRMSMYCFYQDNNKKTITQLFPNSYAQSAFREQNEALEIPSAEMPFTIEMDAASIDNISCFGTKNDITSSLGFDALQPFNGSMSEVKNRINRLSNGSVVEEKITITIQ